MSSLVALSPLMLERLDGQAQDWERLSFIGQTYRAASAILSVLALIGVSVSLLLQAREAKATREQALRMLLRISSTSTRRERHFHELLDEEYRRARTSYVPPPAPESRSRSAPRVWPMWPVVALLAGAVLTGILRRLLSGRDRPGSSA